MEKEEVNPETTRQEVIIKVNKALEKEQSFDSRKYGVLDLQLNILTEWKERPIIDGSKEPLRVNGNARIILIQDKGKGVSIQLHLNPEGEEPRVKHVYVLDLPEGKPPMLTTYIDKPVGPSTGDVPSPMLPFNIKTVEASIETLKNFSNFIEQGEEITSGEQSP